MFSLKMCIFSKAWWFNFVVVMSHRWAGLLSMCRSFLSLLKKKSEGRMKFTAFPPRFYFSLLSCYMLCLLISATNKKVVVCSAKYTGLTDRKISSCIFPVCLLCRSFKCRDGRKKKNSITQNLFCSHLICAHMGSCILSLT